MTAQTDQVDDDPCQGPALRFVKYLLTASSHARFTFDLGSFPDKVQSR